MRTTRPENTHPEVDLTVPIDKNKVMSDDRAAHGDDCFSKEWDMADALCANCADKEVCGILFNARLKKKVKEFEADKPKPLDIANFDGISTMSLKMWLATKPRRFGEFITHVQELSKCDDRKTVQYWCKGFILDRPKLYEVKDKVIIFKKAE